MEIMNHREMEYETNKLFEAHNIKIENNCYWFSCDEKALDLMKWLDKTSKEVSIRDIELDYGLDCIRGYLMFEKVPKTNDIDMDTWEECSLEGVYKYICKYYRAMHVIYHANREGLYSDLDIADLLNSINTCAGNVLKYIHMENTMPNRHNVMAVLMDELKIISKICKVASLTVKQHDEEISHAVANSGSVNRVEDDSLVNKSVDEVCKKYMTIVSPFIPYITEQCWKLFDSDKLAIEQIWSFEDINEKIIIKLPVQVNGKTKAVIEIDDSLEDEEIKKVAFDKVKKYLSDNYKIIYVKNKIINFTLA